MTTSTAPAPLGDLVRLADVEFFMSYPFDVFARMRAEAPVYWSEDDQAWALTKYEDIRQVSKSPHLFSNRFGQIAPQCLTPDDGRPVVDDPITGCPMPRRAVLRAEMIGRRTDILTSVDPPRHTFLRKIASSAFTPKAISLLEQHVAELAVAQVDRIEPGRRDGLRRHGGGAGADAGDRGDARCVDRSARRLPALVRRLHRAERPERDSRRGRDQPVLRLHHRVQRLLHQGAAGSRGRTRATTCSPRSRTPTTTASR